MTTGPTSEKLRKGLHDAQRLIRAADKTLSDLIQDALRQLPHRYLVRWRPPTSRIKSLASIKRKARQQKWPLADAIKLTSDLVGYRVVCHTVKDVRRLSSILQQALRSSGMAVTVKSYLDEPSSDGYRALHLLVRIPIKIGSRGLAVGCEVQLRSLLQDSWASLSRADFYQSRTEVPEFLRTRMRRLSKLLERAGRTADDIRQRLARPVRGRKPRKGERLSQPTLAYIFRMEFGEDSPAYLLELGMRMLEGMPARSDGLADVLADVTLRRRLEAAYAREAPLSPDSHQYLLWSIYAYRHGHSRAIAWAAREGRRDWQEIETVWRREALSGLPESWQELADGPWRIENGEEPSVDLFEWAEALQVSVKTCFCGEKMVNSWDFADALVDYYALSDEEAKEGHEQFLQLVSNYIPEVCPVHGYGTMDSI